MSASSDLSSDLEREQALLERALQRDPASVRRLVRYLEPTLLLRANSLLGYGRGGGREEAMDLVQAAWRELIRDEWRILRNWQPERRVRLRAYVGVVASNRMVSELRRMGSGPEQRVTEPEELNRLAALVDSLEDRISDRQWLEVIVTELRSRLTGQGARAFEVLYLEELSIEEAARRTDLTKASLYSYRRRIKQLVRAIAAEIDRHEFMRPATAGEQPCQPSAGTTHG